MKWAALIAWVITAGGGFVLLSIWLMRGGMRQEQVAGNRIRPPLILSHFLLAAGGLVVWIIYLVADKDALAWVAFGDILFFFGVLLVGFAYLWRRGDLDWVRSVAAQRAAGRDLSSDPVSRRARETVAVTKD